MNKFIFVFGVVVAVFGLTYFIAQAKTEVREDSSGDSGRKIIVFKAGLSEATKDEVIKNLGGKKLKNLNWRGARVAQFSEREAAEKLKENPDVERVDEDVEVFTQAVTQPIPWGIDKIDAELVWPLGNTADPIKVGIIDTGISSGHPDLLGNVKGGTNTINPRKNWNDDNGHGSHVAGTVAALHNSVGAVGAAPKADLYAIKVLSASGSGYLSDIIEGIQWAITNKMKVINLSLGTGSNIQSFHDAIISAKNAGVVVVAAAGNSGGAVLYPAAYPEAIAVSATDKNDLIASFSSRGPEVDISAPGVSIYSTYKGKAYATLSGTSMAAPHATGAIALLLNTPVGSYDANTNGKWDPDEVQKKIQDKATDLGSIGLDNLYGWGLVNAFKAVQP